MNLEKFTDRAKGFLQSAQTVAIRMSHQRISPEHLLKALLEDDQGMAAGLIKAAGGDASIAVRETDAALAKIPTVSGSGAHSRRRVWTMILSGYSIRSNRLPRRRETVSSPLSVCSSRSARWRQPHLPVKHWQLPG